MTTMPKFLCFGLPTLATGIVGDPSYIFSFLHSTLLLKGPTVPVLLCEQKNSLQILPPDLEGGQTHAVGLMSEEGAAVAPSVVEAGQVPQESGC